jgi:hypothetical protein
MEFAVCYDNSATVLASSIFLTITAAFIILSAFAAARLIALSTASSADGLQAA